MQSLLGKEKDCVTPQRNSTLERVTVILASSRWVYEQDICYFYRCLFDRNHSKLRSLARLPESEEFIKSQVGLLFSLISAQNIRVYRRWGDLKKTYNTKTALPCLIYWPNSNMPPFRVWFCWAFQSGNAWYRISGFAWPAELFPAAGHAIFRLERKDYVTNQRQPRLKWTANVCVFF